MTDSYNPAELSIRLLDLTTTITEAVKERLVEKFGRDDIDTLASASRSELEPRVAEAFPNDRANWRIIVHTLMCVLPNKRMVLVNPLTGAIERTGMANAYGVDLSLLSYEQLAAIEWGWRTAHPHFPEFLPNGSEEMAKLQQRLFAPNSADAVDILMDHRSALGHGKAVAWEGNHETPYDKVHILRDRFNAPPETEAEFKAFVLRNVREDNIADGYMGMITGVFRTLHVKGHNKCLSEGAAVVIDRLTVTGGNTRGKVILAPGCTVNDTFGIVNYGKVDKTWQEIYEMIKPK